MVIIEIRFLIIFHDGDDDIELPMAPGPNYNEARIKLVDSYPYCNENKKKDSNKSKNPVKQHSEMTIEMLKKFLSDQSSILEQTSSTDH